MKTQVERSIAYWCDGDTQNFHRTSLLASGLNPTDGPTLEAIASAYTRQQLGDIAYNAVTTLVDPIDLYLWRAFPKAVTA